MIARINLIMLGNKVLENVLSKDIFTQVRFLVFIASDNQTFVFHWNHCMLLYFNSARHMITLELPMYYILELDKRSIINKEYDFNLNTISSIVLEKTLDRSHPYRFKIFQAFGQSQQKAQSHM